MNNCDLIASLSEPGRPNPNEDAAENGMWEWLDGLSLISRIAVWSLLIDDEFDVVSAGRETQHSARPPSPASCEASRITRT